MLITEFKSQLEQLMQAQELMFPPTPGFGSTYKKFLDQSIAHPAKMNTRLLEFLVDTFTREGDVVLDPMSGSGSTGVVAALHGRNAVCVELEEKFFKWMEQARKKVETQQTLARKGRIRNVLGDARKLSTLLEEADIVLTSPPYSESMSKKRKGYTTHPELANTRHMGLDSKDENIGNLRHGKVDVVVTSPPYGDTNDKKNRKMDSTRGIRNRALDLPENTENIGNLKHGRVDSIIMSPPYADAKKGDPEKQRKQQQQRIKSGKVKLMRPDVFFSETNVAAHGWMGYSESEENIGNLRFADCIVTSPPYEAQLPAQDREFVKDNLNTKRTSGKGLMGFGQAMQTGYSNEKNIGSLHKETYLEAMLTVYQQMHSVLKPDGKAIIIIKPFIRNKKVVDLPYQTWLLLKKAGFRLTQLFKLRLKQQSFWRILYHRKFPDVAQIKHEYILICTK